MNLKYSKEHRKDISSSAFATVESTGSVLTDERG